MALPAWHLSHPIIAPDEIGYLSDAWALAGWGQALVANVGSYPVGYPLLLLPLAALLRSPLALYRATLLLNAALSAALVLSVQTLLRRLHFSPRAALAAAIAVALHPSLVTFAHLCFSENLFVPLQAVAMLSLLVLVETRATGAAVVFGAALGFIPFVRVIGVATTMAGALVLAGLLWRDRAMSRRLVPAGVAAALAAAVPLAARHRLPDLRAYAGVSSADVLLSALASPVSVARELCGQLVSISLSTGLLFPVLMVGAARLLPRSLDRSRRVSSAESAVVFVGLVAAGTLAISVAFMHGQPRPDHAIYARYNEGLLAVIACGGLYVLRERVAPSWLVGWPAIAALTMLSLGARTIAEGSIEVVNVAALFVPLQIFGWRSLPVVAFTGSALAVPIAQGFRCGYRRTAVLAVIVLHLLGGTTLLMRYQIPGAELRRIQSTLLGGLTELVGRVALDESARDDWTRSKARFALPRAEIVDAPAGAELVLARKGTAAPRGFVAGAVEERGGLVAFVREDVWARAGLGPALELPPETLANARVHVEIEELTARGARLLVRARIVNLGDDLLPSIGAFTESPWPRRPVRLELRMSDAHGAPAGEADIDLASSIRAGTSGRVQAVLPLTAGAARVEIVLAQQGGGALNVPHRYEIQRDASRRGP